ncbi:hypothetical protein VR010_10750 [Actinomycetaceae bacterium L2_0104]
MADVMLMGKVPPVRESWCAMAPNGHAVELAKRLGALPDPTTEELADGIALFAELGWAMCQRWHRAGTLQVLDMIRHGASDSEVDEAITELWNNENSTWIKHAAAPMRTWANSHQPLKQIMWTRATLMEKAIAHHFAGAYEASIPIINAQIEGLTRDLTNQSFFSTTNEEPYMDDETLAGMDSSLPAVRKLFREPVPTSGHYGKVSRHGVHHGRDLAYDTRANSTKAIVLFIALVEFLPKLAANKSDRLRRRSEGRVAGSRELDEKGRLVDDRHVPEVQSFAIAFAGQYANSLLNFPRRVFDAKRSLTELSSRHGLHSKRLTLREDDEGWMWQYKLPAGQILGYAARPSTSTKRLFPDVWRWDAPEAPADFPWRNDQDWRSDDDAPPFQPNWDPEPLI